MDPSPEYPGPPSTDPPPSTSTSHLLPPSPEQVVLSWNPLQLPERVNSQTSTRSHGASSSTAFLNPATNYLESTPQENPPEYIAARRPTEPITYSFSTLSFNSMILIPPEDAQDTRPLYRITVTMNCFMPTSFITTIVRGASEYGDYVGEFEMGISTNKSTVLIRETEYLMKNLLKGNSGAKPYFTWYRDAKPFLIWNFRTLPGATCRLTNKEQTILAMFYPATKLRRPRQPPILSQLEVRPKGQEYFDDLLMALLIIERKRLTPSEGELFN